ncbi:MAG: hypothetical protein ABH950_09015 [Candidatus Altiarchaeota archaeon]
MDLEPIKLGLKAAVISTSCCTTPLILGSIAIFTGLISLTSALAFAKYKYYLLALSILFYIATTYSILKGKKSGTCQIRKPPEKRTFIAVSFITYAVVTILVIYLILPIMAEKIYGI